MSADQHDHEGPIRVYGASVSYYTGKLEAYLRYKGIPYEFVPRAPAQLRKTTGAAQVPGVLLPDGRWMTDTTPILLWFEAQHPGPAIVPEDPTVGFIARVIEDYADEWLWRSAMHYRWSYAADRALLSRVLADELMTDSPLPSFVKRFMIRRRQHGLFVAGDGVTEATRPHVEQGYLRVLDLLSESFARRPFLLGDRPSLADFGFVGPMLRHFSHDPTPAEILVDRAPRVWEWLARTWNAREEGHGQTSLVHELPDDLGPLLTEIAETHIAALRVNADAFAAGQPRHDATIQGTTYRSLPTSRYRVWCWEELHRHAQALPETALGAVRGILEKTGDFGLVFQPPPKASGYDPDRRVPFSVGLEVLTEPEG